jgi:dolichol-phosphate mannosyltransferase
MATELTMDAFDVVDTAWQVPTYDVHEFSAKRTRYCVCIPIINEGERIKNQLAEMKRQGISEIADILILDGGSKDGSTNHDLLKSLGVSVLLVKTGPGRLSAQLRMGYAYALQRGYDGIVTIDGNGKDGFEAIPNFVSQLEAGYDLVQGSRYVPGGKAINTPLSRSLAIKLIHAPISSLASGFHYTDTTNGFRGYSRKFLLDDRVQPFRDVFTTYELIAYLSIRAPRLGFKTIETPVTRQYPSSGKIPTKISHVSGNLLVFRILFKTAFGGFNPK